MSWIMNEPMTLDEYIEANRIDGDTVWMGGGYRGTWIQLNFSGDGVCLDGDFKPEDLRKIADYLEKKMKENKE